MTSEKKGKEKSIEEKNADLMRIEEKISRKKEQMKSTAIVLGEKQKENKHLTSLHQLYEKDLEKEQRREKDGIHQAFSAIRDHIQFLLDNKKLTEANAKDAIHELGKIDSMLAKK